jgi:hypothetical protein
MYTSVLLVHSWVRWAVILCALWAIWRAVAGATGGRRWLPADDRAGQLFTAALDAQVVLGLLLYFALSPITWEAMRDFGGAMKISGTRFYAVEHVFGVVVGLLLAHRGRSRVRSMSDPARKHRVAAIFFILALVAILAAIPWPGTPNARPLFRW